MSNITKIEWTKNHKQEIEFTNSWDNDKYILYLQDGDVTPLCYIVDKGFTGRLFIPCITYCPDFSGGSGICTSETYTLDDNDFLASEGFYSNTNIIPDFSPYINKESTVLFLNQESFDKLRINYDISKCFIYDKIDGLISDCLKTFKFITLITSELHSENIEEINNICKELKEKYRVERVEVIATHCFFEKIGKIHTILYNDGFYKPKFINKIITTNSTSILEPQNSERLQVIDCIEFFKGL